MGICEERDRRALTGLACARQARLKPILFSNTPGRNLHEPWINSLTKEAGIGFTSYTSGSM